jgi:DNA-binding transcriptional MerR regulator
MNKAQEKETEKWDAKPYIFLVNGKELEFFSIGQLGKALGNRSAVTLRKWEREGILPKSPYTKPSDDPRGRRRMYTRAMVEGLVKIAKEEGVWLPDKGRRLSETMFKTKAVALFKRLLQT